MPDSVILRAGSAGPMVLLPHDVISTIARYQLPEESDREAGGIFIGLYRGRHIEVVACTEPMLRDVRTPYSFDRKDPGHNAGARQRWKESHHVLTFVGEWHTHPEPTPSPSSIDRRTWTGVMKQCAPNPIIFAISGTAAIWYGFGQRGSISKLATVMSGA